MNGLERRKLKSRSHRVEEFLWDVEKHTFLMIYTDAIVFMRCRKTYVPNAIVFTISFSSKDLETLINQSQLMLWQVVCFKFLFLKLQTIQIKIVRTQN
jgi:hypothetical protein